MSVCDTGLCKGKQYLLHLQFEANPVPSKVSLLLQGLLAAPGCLQVVWTMRSHNNRMKTAVTAGERLAGFQAELLEDVSRPGRPDRWSHSSLGHGAGCQGMSPGSWWSRWRTRTWGWTPSTRYLLPPPYFLMTLAQLMVTNSMGVSTFILQPSVSSECQCRCLLLSPIDPYSHL